MVRSIIKGIESLLGSIECIILIVQAGRHLEPAIKFGAVCCVIEKTILVGFVFRFRIGNAEDVETGILCGIASFFLDAFMDYFRLLSSGVLDTSFELNIYCAIPFVG